MAACIADRCSSHAQHPPYCCRCCQRCYVCLQWPVQQNSLRWLSDHYLQQTIQSGAHDSKEDAIAALRLVNIKLQQGPFFDKSQNADTHNLIVLLHEQDRYMLLL